MILRAALLFLLMFACFSCEEFKINCDPVPVVIPDQFAFEEKNYQGDQPNLEKWWAQLQKMGFGDLIDKAYETNATLQIAKNELREACYKYGMKEKDVEELLTALNNEIRIPYLPPENFQTIPTAYTASHVATQVLPKNFSFGNENYLQIFAFLYYIDLFNRAEFWRKTALNEIKGLIENVKGIASTVRLEVCQQALSIREYRNRIKTLSGSTRETKGFKEKIRERVEAGIQESEFLTDLGLTESKIRDRINFLLNEEKRVFLDLMQSTGINDLEELKRLVGSSDEMPQIDTQVLVGTPIRVIQQKPSVKEKLNNLEHVCGMVGLAVADRFPMIYIGSILQTTASSIYKLFDLPKFSYAFGYRIEHKIFEQAKVTANILLHRSQYKQAQAEYQQAVTDALTEVARKMLDKTGTEGSIKGIEKKISQIELKRNAAIIRSLKSVSSLVKVADLTVEKHLLEDEKKKFQFQSIIDTMALVQALGG